ncbi:unnamed protein product [Phytophthora lilii]|uniref:Unnamed protein product n=1 Tax=Phytophthora lilii TaxID=2077276 RepID=A0A9W6U7W6_9STRA|nr:unnamed protein product [Phytophthora lilii]
MSLPPIINSPLFNSSYFNSSNGYLTLTTGDQRYLRLGGVGSLSALNVIGNMNCGSLTINGSSLDLSGLSYLSGVTPGAASASNALVLDSSSNISGINSLQTTTLILGSLTLTSTEASYLTGLTTGVAQANKAITVNGSLNVSGINNLSASGITGTIQTAAQPNITSLGNLTLPASLTITNGTTPISITNTMSSSSFNVTIQNSGGAQDIGSTTAHQLALRTNGIRRLTISSGGNVTIADTASGLQLDLGSTGTGLNVPNLTFRGTTFPDTYYTGISLGGAWRQKRFYSTLNINGLSMTADANELNYNDLTTLGTFQASKSMTLDSSGVGLMPLSTSSTNNLRFYGGTVNRETMNIYRVSDTNGLVIASRTTSASNNKTYPLLNLISTDNPSSFVGGVSATSADLFTINWNDKPSVGFTS